MHKTLLVQLYDLVGSFSCYLKLKYDKDKLSFIYVFKPCSIRYD